MLFPYMMFHVTGLYLVSASMLITFRKDKDEGNEMLFAIMHLSMPESDRLLHHYNILCNCALNQQSHETLSC